MEQHKRQGKLYPEVDVWRVAKELFLALQHLHGKRVMHRDIKMVRPHLTLLMRACT